MCALAHSIFMLSLRCQSYWFARQFAKTVLVDSHRQVVIALLHIPPLTGRGLASIRGATPQAQTRMALLQGLHLTDGAPFLAKR